MIKLKYSITGDDEMDTVLCLLTGDSANDPRFKFSIGDYVYVEVTAGGSGRGTIAQIRGMRNAYPEPFFTGYWFPSLFLRHIDGSEGGGEIGESCVRLATQEEIEAAQQANIAE